MNEQLTIPWRQRHRTTLALSRTRCLLLDLFRPHTHTAPPPFFPRPTLVSPDPAAQVVGEAGSGLAAGLQPPMQAPEGGGAGARQFEPLRDSACHGACHTDCHAPCHV